ncbi:hypothetical protein H7X46_02800 [Pseudonocardia sp. C8]|uniref:hypothetical protein n=1 Tax=Pseudonocardia sp. C8 TaxID=2762759 RepID=UPI0016433059|nr:hypothetical protein [Pseudonocardia sp. C8]MBC3189991.1 hypothetical protein [Pseudonocardia sp. C8]
MTGFVMAGSEPSVLLHHLAFYGLADILDDAGAHEVRLTWEGSRPTVHAEGLTARVVDDAVRAHVDARRSWVDVASGKDRRGVMSPRLSAFKDDASWTALQRARHGVFDALIDARAWPDLRYLAALGEPSYWSFNQRDEPLQDDGASRWEMQPRNRGSEFVGNRLRPVAEAVSARGPGGIAAGIDGSKPVDEIGGRSDSVSATGLSTPGPVDNALVWCALWGLGWLPTALRVAEAALSSGHFGRPHQEYFFTPYWTGALRPARVRSLLASEHLRVAATDGVERYAADPLVRQTAHTWLRARRVVGVLRFPIGRFGSDNAPERRALRAEAVQIGDSP